MKRLLGLLLLVALLAVLDRGAAAYAERALATELQSSGGLVQRPQIDVGGFPFLTQAVRGRYDRIEVAATDVPAGERTLTRLDAVLTGVRVPLGDVVSGVVDEVPVDAVDARVVLSYAELSRVSGDRRLTVAAAGDRVRVTGEVEVLGRQVEASAVSTVALEGDVVVVTAQAFEVGSRVADAVLTRALRGRLDLRVPVRDLPYGLVLESITTGPDGVVVRTTASDTVLRAR